MFAYFLQRNGRGITEIKENDLKQLVELYQIYLKMINVFPKTNSL